MEESPIVQYWDFAFESGPQGLVSVPTAYFCKTSPCMYNVIYIILYIIYYTIYVQCTSFWKRWFWCLHIAHTFAQWSIVHVAVKMLLVIVDFVYLPCGCCLFLLLVLLLCCLRFRLHCRFCWFLFTLAISVFVGNVCFCWQCLLTFAMFVYDGNVFYVGNNFYVGNVCFLWELLSYELRRRQPRCLAAECITLRSIQALNMDTSAP